MKIQMADTLKKLREEKGITQSTLAKALSVSNQAISRWENGAAYPDIEQLPDIASYFNISIDDLLGYGLGETGKLCEQLTELKRQPQNSVIEYQMREVLERLVDRDQHHYLSEYFALTMKLYRLGMLGDVHVEKARNAWHRHLSELDADHVSFTLLNIMRYEEEQSYGIWQRYTHMRSDVRCWNDVLLHTHRGSEKYNEYLPQNLFEKLELFVRTLSEGHYSYDCADEPSKLSAYFLYKQAQEMINVFSKREEDICLRMRIRINTELAAACFGTGRDEEGFALLGALCRQMPMIYRLMDEKIPCRGSSEMLKSVEKVLDKQQDVDFLLEEVNGLYNDTVFDRVRDCERIVCFHKTLGSLLAEVHRFTLQVCPENGITEEFVLLYGRAEAILSELGYTRNLYVILLSTVKNGLFSLVTSHEHLAQDADKLMEDMKSAGDTEASAIVCKNKVGFADMAPYYLCKKLVELDERNQNAKFMYGSKYGMYTKRLCEMPMMKPKSL